MWALGLGMHVRDACVLMTAGSHAAGERLYRAHDHVQKARDRKVTEALTEELAGCTFQPKLRARSARNRPHVPLQKRAGDLVKQRNERIAQCVPPLPPMHACRPTPLAGHVLFAICGCEC